MGSSAYPVRTEEDIINFIDSSKYDDKSNFALLNSVRNTVYKIYESTKIHRKPFDVVCFIIVIIAGDYLLYITQESRIQI